MKVPPLLPSHPGDQCCLEGFQWVAFLQPGLDRYFLPSTKAITVSQTPYWLHLSLLEGQTASWQPWLCLCLFSFHAVKDEGRIDFSSRYSDLNVAIYVQ